jgi:eukaryotic-like serine/threonine-protein kinase
MGGTRYTLHPDVSRSSPDRATIVIGKTLGPYAIVAKLGEGGMGEVYRARDTTLNRDVAIKVLPEVFAADADRLSRFTREAQALASLNHPNIAGIYAVEHRAIVMELVDGEDLSHRIEQGALPLADALPIAKQIADALDVAHQAGIIHRDLKPANIKVRGDGTVKVLDFGLAKAVAPGASKTDGAFGQLNSPTFTDAAFAAGFGGPGTQMGMILGTAAYMAPEQAKGRAVDCRADVWAFGCVLYEMLTGQRAFPGEDVTETLAAIVRGEPDWTRLPAGLPANVRVLLERCLVKDRAERLPDMSVVRFLMSDTAKSLSGAPATTSTIAAPRRLAAIVIGAVALAGVATFGVTRWLLSSDVTTPAAPTRAAIVLPDGDEVGSTYLLPIALSEDGTRLAYVGRRNGKTRIYIRGLAEAEPRALDGTDGGEGPFFSPDGQWVAFFAGSRLRKIAVGGAALQTLAEAANHRGGVWSRDGYIYFAPTNTGGIWRVPEDGGAATEVTRKNPATGEISHRWPHVAAGTSTLLFAVWTGPGYDEASIAVQTIGSPGHQVLVKGADAPRYAATPGLLLYTRIGQLFAVPWQPSQTTLGRAVPVAMAVQTNVEGNEGQGNYALSANGTLAYLTGGRGLEAKRLVWIDRQGTLEPAPVPERTYENVVIAPDQTRAIVQILEGITSLWTYDFSRNTLTPIANSTASSQAPLYTADGTRVIYRATRQGLRNLYWRLVDGSGDEEPLTSKPDVSQTPTSVSGDGRWLLYNENGAQESGGVGVWVIRLDGDRTPGRVFTSPNGENDAQFSPDGRWIAYQAPVSSRQEIYVAPFPGPGPRRQVSIEGGTEPLWSHDGRELLFQSGARLMSVVVTPGTTLSMSAPRVVHEGRFFRSINGNSSWAMTRDGTRFLRIQQVEPERAVTHIALALNWFEEASRLVTR